MTEPITYKINKRMAFYTKDAFMFCLICTIAYFIAGKIAVIWVCLLYIIVSLFRFYKISKNPIGEIAISSEFINVRLYDKKYYIKHSDIYKLVYYRSITDKIYLGKIIYCDTEENSFTIGMEQAEIKKIKNTIEEKMNVKIKRIDCLSKKDMEIIKKEDKLYEN